MVPNGHNKALQASVPCDNTTVDKRFEDAFRLLNKEQRQAVTTIAGPVLVIAGPGTGKTQLLALRAAYILRQDSTMLPSNILCLTFTDNAADNMRRRLTHYIGQDAYQASIHTFNSFGNYIMNAYPEYFSEWRELLTADELTTYRLLEEILSQLPGDHDLAHRGADGTCYALKQLRNLISDAKRSDLEPADFKAILTENEAAFAKLTPLLQAYWPERLSKDSLPGLHQLAKLAAGLKPVKPSVEAVAPFFNMAVESLLQAAGASAAAGGRNQTKPFTAWKNTWLARDDKNRWQLKAAIYHHKLLAAAEIYRQYQAALADRGLADFNDQIMMVLRALKRHSELRYNLQERFQYVMIDEFQDTNRAQLLLAHFVSDAPVHEGRPNILAVGDDDQAIFRFQGADIGNVGVFVSSYRQPKIVTLVKNYRSSRSILDASRRISTQLGQSLEKQKRIVKQLVATVETEGSSLKLNELENLNQHDSWVAGQIKRLLDNGLAGNQIVVLARERAQLDSLVPHLRQHQIAIDYERSEHVLEQPHIKTLITMARLVSLLGRQRLEEANALLPEVLSEPFWGIRPLELWRVALSAYKDKRLWLDVILEQKNTPLARAAAFLIELGSHSSNWPAEQVLDRLVGNAPAGARSETDDDPAPAGTESGPLSPFKAYFFGEELLHGRPTQYLRLLSHLATLRRHWREYQAATGGHQTISELIDFVDAYQRTETLRMLDSGPHCEKEDAVQLMTVHKAKGLEFHTVFVVGLQDSVWTKTGHSNRFSYPPNLLEIRPTDNQADDALRLLFVAMTRARQSLQLCYFLADDAGRAQQPYGPLLDIAVKPNKVEPSDNLPALVEQYQQRWITRHGSVERADMRACLKEALANYQLSVTHLNNFLDVANGGPHYFLTQNLLNFPASRSVSSIYGSAVHRALRQAHEQAAAHQKINLKAIIAAFKDDLARQPLAPADRQRLQKTGQRSLSDYLNRKSDTFLAGQRVETDFRDQGVVVGQSRLRGMIDLMDLGDPSKTITVTDYKTGRPYSRWQLSDAAEEYQKIKLRRYRQQLLFYKLLVDGSSEWGKRGWRAAKGRLRFIEPDARGRLHELELIYEADEIDNFTRLVTAVWQHIQALDFPPVDVYPPTLEGVIAFEADLLKKAGAG